MYMDVKIKLNGKLITDSVDPGYGTSGFLPQAQLLFGEERL